MKYFLLLTFLTMSLSSCVMDNGKIVVTMKNDKKVMSLSNVQLSNNQFILTGTNLADVKTVTVKEGSTEVLLVVESVTATQLIANTLSSVTFAAGKAFEFVLATSEASSTFNVNFSLCDSSLNGKGFNCSISANDKDVLSFDATTNKWVPRNVNGLNYKGTFSAAGGVDPTGSPDAGDYYIITVAGTINSVTYAVGDWISYSGDEWQKIANARTVLSVFGRTGNITARKGDYDLSKLTDVDFTSRTPVAGDVLKFVGGKWSASASALTETDPTVSVFAKAALPTCPAGQVLTSTNGTSLSCVADATGGGGGPTGAAGGDLAGTYPNPTLAVVATAGTYNSVTVDTKGRVTAGTNPTTLAGYGITDSIVTGVTGTAPVTVTGTTAPVVSMAAATAAVNGYLTSANWTAFNGKQDSLAGGQTINGIVYPSVGQTLKIPLAPVVATDAVNKQYVDNNGVWTVTSGNASRGSGMVSIGTATPEMSLTIAGDGGIIASGTKDSGADLVSAGSGTRLIWQPKKSVFRVGTVSGTQWDAANNGDYSFATGLDTKASGPFSFASGVETVASANHSFASGYRSVASGSFSVAMTSGSLASGFASVALGADAISSGFGAVALGSGANASGYSSIAVGQMAVSSGTDTIAIGSATSVTGYRSVGVGYSAVASGFSTAAFGNYSAASGTNSAAFGNYASSSGSYATAIGYSATAAAFQQITLGSFNTTPALGSNGDTSWNLTDPLLVVGNGTAANAKSTALTILKNGKMGIGVAAPAEQLDVLGNIKSSGCLYYSGGNTGACASDERIKKDVHTFDVGLDALLGINPVKFKYNGLAGFAADDKEQLGVIAQNVERAAPELVQRQMVQLHKDDSYKTEIKIVDYGAFTYVIINSIKEFFHKWFTDSADIHREIASIKKEMVAKDRELLTLKKQVKETQQENSAIKTYLCKKDPTAPICK